MTNNNNKNALKAVVQWKVGWNVFFFVCRRHSLLLWFFFLKRDYLNINSHITRMICLQKEIILYLPLISHLAEKKTDNKVEIKEENTHTHKTFALSCKFFFFFFWFEWSLFRILPLFHSQVSRANEQTNSIGLCEARVLLWLILLLVFDVIVCERARACLCMCVCVFGWLVGWHFMSSGGAK